MMKTSSFSSSAVVNIVQSFSNLASSVYLKLSYYCNNNGQGRERGKGIAVLGSAFFAAVVATLSESCIND